MTGAREPLVHIILLNFTSNFFFFFFLSLFHPQGIWKFLGRDLFSQLQQHRSLNPRRQRRRRRGRRKGGNRTLILTGTKPFGNPLSHKGNSPTSTFFLSFFFFLFLVFFAISWAVQVGV